ncbi:hypothetical protein EDD34_2903 [Myceligenerans xiligouense]|uniref:HEAT repeat protein n=2 Tax=Myceligenerans xiligouense TaxID=253184 RepID=A0A3N4YNQ0_9MICO|nr:hypothetical protein EDD34_2903 [Myceligenerans xiligouense]
MRAWDAIDWASLEHNYGSADDIPGLLERCTSVDGDEVANAIAELENALYHQGGWICSAASAALPFLLDFALKPETHHRAAFVHLVWDHCNTWHEVDERWVDAAWPAAAGSVEPQVRDLLADHDPRVRRPAIGVAAGLLTPPTAEVLLVDLLETEQDQATRIDLLEALSVVLKRDVEHASARSVLERVAASDDPQLRIAALLALPDAADRAGRLVDAARVLPQMDAEPWKESASYDIGLGGVLSAILNTVLPNQDACIQLLTMFLATPQGSPVPDELVRVALAGCGRLVSRRRDAAEIVATLVGPHLTSPEAGTRYTACYLLACVGDAAAPYANDIAPLLQDRAVEAKRHARRPVAAAATWALARIGDVRCLPPVRDELAGRSTNLTTTKYSSGGSYFTVWDVSIDDVVRPLRAHADVLLPDILTAMTRKDRPFLTLRLAEVIQDWDVRGRAPAGVVSLLKHDEMWWHAAIAIGSLGRVARRQRGRAVRLLAQRAVGDDGRAAWAYRRLTGRDVFSDQTLSRVLDAAITTKNDIVGISANLLPYAATSPLATERDLARLRQLTQEHHDAVRLTAAAALCLLTSGAEGSDVVATIAQQGQSWPARTVAFLLRHLRGVSAAHDILTPVARDLAEGDDRPGTNVGWPVIAEDERYSKHARHFLDRPGGGQSQSPGLP